MCPSKSPAMSISSLPVAMLSSTACSNLTKCPTPRPSTSCNSWTNSVANGLFTIRWMTPTFHSSASTPLRLRRWVYKNNPVLPRFYTSYDKLEYFCLPFAAGRVGLQHKTAVAQSMGLPSSFFFQLKEKCVPFCVIGSTAS